MNHVLNVEAFVARSLPGGHSKPTSLFFALNVGMDSSGSVFIASGSQSCCHWTVCHVDREKKKIVYDDSLAWSVPVDHLPTLKQFIEHIYGECLFDYEQPIYMIRWDPLITTKTRHFIGWHLKTMTRETVMTAQSIGQVVERSIEVNEEPGSLVNVLNLNILVFNYQTWIDTSTEEILGLLGRECSKVGSVYVLSVAIDVSGLRN